MHNEKPAKLRIVKRRGGCVTYNIVHICLIVKIRLIRSVSVLMCSAPQFYLTISLSYCIWRLSQQKRKLKRTVRAIVHYYPPCRPTPRYSPSGEFRSTSLLFLRPALPAKALGFLADRRPRGARPSQGISCPANS